eukprot:CAMPEP_0118930354 /NCGR_PEP_ID=MMETSP1169-20130426/7072_1 /TAXON_ID=36882 /ORGANISM="Pyramimonas obovata, Strain CCMP722" /LENGTH=384 /DNA_ID=CAMNT_0006872697 /DNA_START=74 /DNA_END=1228 /DNA_ORIENTATION=+
MFGKLKMGSALRAKALAAMQENQRNPQKGGAGGDKPKKEEWELPDPRTDWEQFSVERKEEAETAKRLAQERMAARAAASAKQAERRRQYAEASARAQSARTGRPPPTETASSSETTFEDRPRTARSAQNKAPPESYYVRLYVHYRGITTPQEIVLTDDEYTDYTVGQLKVRISGESGVLAHADASIVLCTRDGHAVRQLRDGDKLPAVLREGDHVAVQPLESRGAPPPPSSRPTSAPAARPMTPAERVERVVRAQKDQLWRGFKREDPPADLSKCSRMQLQRFLQQAGVAADMTLSGPEAAEVARAHLATWEVERVLACDSHLEVLRLERNPIPADVKASFRKLSMLVHPDKNSSPKAAEAMSRVTKAYQGLLSARIGRPAQIA